MNPFRGHQQRASGAKKAGAKNAMEWGIIVAGFIVGTLLWIPQTRPDFMKPTPEPVNEEVEAPQRAQAPRAQRPAGKLVALYSVNPPMHPDDAAMIEKAKEYMELQYGLDRPVEIGIKPHPPEVCMARSGGVINEEAVRCKSGYRVTVTLTRATS